MAPKEKENVAISMPESGVEKRTYASMNEDRPEVFNWYRPWNPRPGFIGYILDVLFGMRR